MRVHISEYCYLKMEAKLHVALYFKILNFYFKASENLKIEF
jgi:hypothetical protein